MDYRRWSWMVFVENEVVVVVVGGTHLVDVIACIARTRMTYVTE